MTKGTKAARQAITSVQWTWYTWRDHMRAELRMAGYVITLACPLTGGPVTYSMNAVRSDDEGIPFEQWASTGYRVSGFARDPSRPVQEDDGDGYTFRPYLPVRVLHMDETEAAR